MSDPFANAQLELAVRVGSRDAIVEAIEEGADIDFGESSPLIIAIMAGDRATISTLVELGADLSCFELRVDGHDAVVDALMAGAASGDEAPEEDPVDAKLVRAFDKMLRTKGFGEPIKKQRASEFAAFAEGLKWIAAEECLGITHEFLALLDPVRAASGDAGLGSFLEDEAEAIAALSERYAAAEEAPTELLKDYLKERKKLAK